MEGESEGVAPVSLGGRSSSPDGPDVGSPERQTCVVDEDGTPLVSAVFRFEPMRYEKLVGAYESHATEVAPNHTRNYCIVMLGAPSEVLIMLVIRRSNHVAGQPFFWLGKPRRF